MIMQPTDRPTGRRSGIVFAFALFAQLRYRLLIGEPLGVGSFLKVSSWPHLALAAAGVGVLPALLAVVSF